MNMLIDKLSGKLMALFTAIAFIVSASISVSAAEAQIIELKQSGEQAEIILTFPQAAKEEISSLQISLSAVLGSDGASVEFIPGANLSAKIAEGRFNKETGVLNIYIADTAPLFNKENPVLSLGYVKAAGENCYADVKVIKDSLKFVRGTELVVQDTGVEYPESSVRITSESGVVTTERPSGGGGSGGFITPETTVSSSEPVQTPVSSDTAPVSSAETSLPAITTAAESSAVSGNTGGTAPPEENVPAIPVEGESFSRADTKALNEAVSRAELYKRSDYSDSSYRGLREAVEKAKAILLNSEANQEQVDEALLILENAIGMLVPSNTPSRVEDVVTDETNNTADNDTNEDESASSVSEEDNPADSEQSASDTTTPPQSDESFSDQPSETQPELKDTEVTEQDSVDNSDKNAENLTPWIIVLVILAVAVVVIAVAAVINSNKKKSKKGSHSKNGQDGRK